MSHDSRIAALARAARCPRRARASNSWYAARRRLRYALTPTRGRRAWWLLSTVAVGGLLGCRPSLPAVVEASVRPNLPADAVVCAFAPGMDLLRVVGIGGPTVPLLENTPATRPGPHTIGNVEVGTDVRVMLEQNDHVLVETVGCQQGWIARAAVQPLAAVVPVPPQPAPTFNPPTVPTVLWRTPFAALGADAVTIEADGQTFSGAGQLVSVHSDPGRSSYRTLEMTWFDHDVEMRLQFYFTADAQDWWVTEIRTYDGHTPGEWIMYTGEFFRSPRGTVFRGDVELQSDVANTYRGQLRIQGMQLAGF